MISETPDRPPLRLLTFKPGSQAAENAKLDDLEARMAALTSGLVDVTAQLKQVADRLVPRRRTGGAR